MDTPIQITAYTAVSALGQGLEAHKSAILSEQSGLSKCDFQDCNLPTYIGRIKDVEAVQFKEEHLSSYHCRNNQVAYLGLQQDNFRDSVHEAIERYGSDRIGTVIGTSTSGFSEFEHLYRSQNREGKWDYAVSYVDCIDFFATTKFINEYFQLSGASLSISTACSSSARSFISASRMLRLKLCDAVIVGGVDSLCLNTLYGFSSLELLSKSLCKPCDENRDGLNLGEAGAFLLLERSNNDTGKIQLLGYGESSDAHHMSSPHPEGIGAQLAMGQALAKSNLTIDAIDYINMHGTSSKINDVTEAKAIHKLFSSNVPSSSTKGWTGHTLGAAGALEAVLCCLFIENGIIPGCLNSTVVDNTIRGGIRLKNSLETVNITLTNSFGFGGNNCSLILGKKK